MGIISSVGGSGTFSSASGGKITGFALATAAVVVAPGNPARQKILFHNPGAIDIFVAPTVVANGASLFPTTASLPACFRIFGGASLEITGECQIPWQAFAASGVDNPLTVMDSNIG